MRLVLHSLAITLGLILLVISASLLVLFSHHERLFSSPDGSAVLMTAGHQPVTSLPRLGRVLEFLRQPVPLILCVFLPAAVVVGWQVRQLWRGYARPPYSARLET